MHVLIVAPEGLPIPPTLGGSVQIYLHALIPELAGRQDLRLTVLSPGTTAARLSQTGLTHEVYGRRNASPSTNARSSYGEWVLQRITTLAPDIVQIENRPQMASRVLHLRRHTPRLQSMKVVLNLHSTTFLGPAHSTHQAVSRCLRNVDAVVLNSQYLKRSVARKFGLTGTADKTQVIYPGVDTLRFTPKAAQTGDADYPALYSVHRPIRLIFIGRVIQLKGVAVLIAAVSRLVRQRVPVRLTIVGRTPPWEHFYGVRVRKASVGLPITWKGFVSPRRLPKLLQEHDVLVCPSQRREAFGLVNLEAMAAGKPVIASRVGGIPEVVTNDAGILVSDYTSSTAFADAVNKLVGDPELYEKLQNGAKKRSKEFSWTNTAHAFERLYKKLSPN